MFFINLPLGLVVLLLALWKVPESRAGDQGQQLDWLGGLLAALGFGGIVFALIESAPAAGAVGGIALIALLYWEARSPSPMVPLHLFRSRNFSGANLLTLFLYSALSGVLFFFPLDLIQVQGYSPTEAGAALLPFILLMFLLSRWSGGLLDRYGAKAPLVVGPLIAAAGFALFARPGIGGSYWTTFFPAVLVLGLGMAISVAPLTTTVMNAVEQSYAGAASGINNAVSRDRRLAGRGSFRSVAQWSFPERSGPTPGQSRPAAAGAGANRGPAIQAGCGRNDGRARPSKRSRKHLSTGYRTVLWVAAGLALASSLTAAALIGSDEQSEHR